MVRSAVARFKEARVDVSTRLKLILVSLIYI